MSLRTISLAFIDTPVRFPPGRPRLLTSPLATGSPTYTMMTGTSRVACFAARLAGVPSVTRTSMLRRTSSAASSGSSSHFPGAARHSMTMLRPSM